MYKIIEFNLLTEVTTKDSTAQTTSTVTKQKCIGQQKSVYQNEFYQAEQAGLRPDGVIKMSAFDYAGQRFIEIGNNKYTIYRIYENGTDTVELYYGERVGN